MTDCKEHIRLYTINGHHWLGIERGGMLYLICLKGPAGWLIQP